MCLEDKIIGMKLHKAIRLSKWFGYHIAKVGTDLFAYQEIIFQTKPDWIIETGTDNGGSALFLAHMLDIINKGKRIGIIFCYSNKRTVFDC